MKRIWQRVRKFISKPMFEYRKQEKRGVQNDNTAGENITSEV